jgi:hypothetical protein
MSSIVDGALGRSPGGGEQGEPIRPTGRYGKLGRIYKTSKKSNAKPKAIPVEKHGLAMARRVLFNENEFLFID